MSVLVMQCPPIFNLSTTRTLDKSWSLPCEQMIRAKHFCKHWMKYIFVDLLGNFAILQKSVEICDGQTEDLGTGGLLLTHLQHPGGQLAPHAGPQLCLEAGVWCLGGQRLVRGQTVANLSLEQHPQHSLIAEDVWVTAASERGHGRAASSLYSHNVCPLHPLM